MRPSPMKPYIACAEGVLENCLRPANSLEGVCWPSREAVVHTRFMLLAQRPGPWKPPVGKPMGLTSKRLSSSKYIRDQESK